MTNPYAAPRFSWSNPEKTIVLLLFLFNLNATDAQYMVNVDGTAPNHQCVITTIGNTNWNDQDLVTWIFPDGQYKQSLTRLVGTVVESGTNVVSWSPYSATQPYSAIRTFVAKKGGTGPPPAPALIQTDITHSINANQALPAPAPINFPQGSSWGIEKMWEFSKDYSNLLVVSYKNECTSTLADKITISYDANQVNIEEIYKFNNEDIINQPGVIAINTFPSNIPYQNFNNVFLKVTLKDIVEIGDKISITATGRFCPGPDSIINTIVLDSEVKGGPHDPNSKTSDIDTISSGQTGPVNIIYTVQFHNDGNAPVKRVVVTDTLPDGLDPATFTLVETPVMNGLWLAPSYNDPNSAIKTLNFEGVDGMPGFGQTSPSYSFGQTIYRFRFKVKTRPGFRETINNTATVVFYDGDNALPKIITDVSQIHYDSSPRDTNEPNTFCSCWKRFWKCLCGKSRRDKKTPASKPKTRR